MNHYQTLGVDKTASIEEIKSAFRKLAKQYHPDVSSDPNAGKIFQKINQAYEILSDEDKRKVYDSQPEYGPSQNQYSYNYNSYSPPRPNKSVKMSYVIDLEDVYNGKSTTVRFQTDVGERMCYIVIPPGVETGTEIRYNGYGHHSNPHQPPGDLILNIYVRSHPLFTRQGLNLYTVKNINILDLLTENTIAIDTLSGKQEYIDINTADLKSPAIRLEGHGLQKGNQTGDLFVIFNPEIPKLTPRQKDIIQEIKQTI